MESTSPRPTTGSGGPPEVGNKRSDSKRPRVTACRPCLAPPISQVRAPPVHNRPSTGQAGATGVSRCRKLVHTCEARGLNTAFAWTPSAALASPRRAPLAFTSTRHTPDSLLTTRLHPPSCSPHPSTLSSMLEQATQHLARCILLAPRSCSTWGGAFDVNDKSGSRRPRHLISGGVRGQTQEATMESGK